MSIGLGSPAELLTHYENIAAISGVMADAAQSGDWATTLALSQQYCNAVTVLCEQADASVRLNAEERDAKHALLLRILANDAATRNSASPQLARLGVLLGNLKRQQTLRHAYGHPAALP